MYSTWYYWPGTHGQDEHSTQMVQGRTKRGHHSLISFSSHAQLARWNIFNTKWAEECSTFKKYKICFSTEISAFSSHTISLFYTFLLQLDAADDSAAEAAHWNWKPHINTVRYLLYYPIRNHISSPDSIRKDSSPHLLSFHWFSRSLSFLHWLFDYSSWIRL